MKLEGFVEYLEDLKAITNAAIGSVYRVLYTGKRDDPPEKIKKVDHLYVFDGEWFRI